jgi:hypothetical protein
MTDPAHPTPARRQARSGCLTVAYVALGLLLLTLVTIGVGTWVFLRSETGQRVVSTAREGMLMARDAANAPGTAALREAGCSQAMVMPFGRMMDLIGEIVTVPPGQVPRGAPDLMVFCQIPSGDVEAPACDTLARIYGQAVPDAPARFGVIVQQSSGRRPVCDGTYSPDGTFLGPFSQERAPEEQPVEPGGAF